MTRDVKLVLCLLVISLVRCSAVFQPHWKSYLAWVIQQHQNKTWPPTVITSPPPLHSSMQGIAPSDMFFLPDVIVWDPLKQYPSILNSHLTVCYEEGCGLPLKLLCWQDGSKPRYTPRCLYGMNGFTVLLCQIFICPRYHSITSCDPRVLKAFPHHGTIPFVLLHRSGVTREMYYTIFDMACQGTSFSDIETFLLWRYQAWYAASLLSYPQETEQQPIPRPTRYISNDLVMELFIMMFNRMKVFVQESMLSLTDEYLSCDHTFKLPKHIGLMRGKKWVSQYDSMFIMQSSKGEVLFWQLTSGTAYSAVNDGLQSLQQRITSAQKRVKMVIIDNCCAWRRKLMDTFGEHVAIKLDIFHAVKRVSGALSKRHPHFYNCIQDWKLVFRSKGDNGPQRKKPTPSPENLMANLQCFVQKWNGVKLEGNANVLNSVALKEVEKLKKHIQKGCLSGIPVNFGTNRNENLHRSINHRLAGHRIGIELAVALLSVFFHTWNVKRSGKPNTSLCASYLCQNSRTDSSSTQEHHLGIGVSTQRMYTKQHLGTAFSSVHSNDPVHVMEQIKRLKDASLPAEELQMHLNTTTEDILCILQFALSCVLLEDTIKSLSNTHPNISRVTPWLSPLIKKQVMTKIVEDDGDLHMKRLANVLESYQLDTVDIAKDGDCLFSSISTYIQQLFKNPSVLSESLLNHLQSIGITSTQPSGLTPYLRELLVHEWLENESEYHPFFDGTMHNFEAESLKYLKCGVFSSYLGDAMLLGLANVLRIPIVVFTSVESWPYFIIHPRTAPVDSKPILLAFLQAGPGHYSLATQRTSLDLKHTSDDSPIEDAPAKASCRCGRGRNASNTLRLNCSTSAKYSSRCPCLRSSQACSPKCMCLNCDNHYGKNCIKKTSEVVARRKRPRHEEQELNRATSIKYMKVCGELPLSGKWTQMEHYVLLAILQYLHHEKQCNVTDELEFITNLYSTVVDTVVNNDIHISLAPKSQAQIKAKLQQCLKDNQLLRECGYVNILPI